jgi:hypothetical protein
MTSEERESIDGLVAVSEETASITQKLHEFMKAGKETGSRSWRAMAVAEPEADSVPPAVLLKLMPAK